MLIKTGSYEQQRQPYSSSKRSRLRVPLTVTRSKDSPLQSTPSVNLPRSHCQGAAQLARLLRSWLKFHQVGLTQTRPRRSSPSL